MDPERLKWLAVAPLSEVVDQVKDGPAAPTFAIRVALATAFAFSDGHKESYVGF